MCVLYCRPADCPQRGGRGQPGGDSWIRQSIQDPPAVPGPDTDSGGPGAQRCWGAGVQSVCHLQVRTNKGGKKSNNKRFIISNQYVLIVSNGSRWSCAASVSCLVLITAIYFSFHILTDIIKILKCKTDYHHPYKWKLSCLYLPFFFSSFSPADMTASCYLCKIHTRVLHEALKAFNNY